MEGFIVQPGWDVLGVFNLLLLPINMQEVNVDTQVVIADTPSAVLVFFRG